MKNGSELTSPGTRRHLRRGRIFFGLLLLGVLLTAWSVHQETRRMRKEVLGQALRMAQSIDFHRVKSLTGTQEERASPAYQRLQTQLEACRQMEPKPERIYLTARGSNGALTVLFDSRREPDANAPPPPADERTTIALLTVFETGRPRIEGPVREAQGLRIRALIPLANPKTGALIAVMGMDMDAHAWMSRAIQSGLLPVATTLILMLLLAFPCPFLFHHACPWKTGPGLCRHKKTCQTISIGLTLTLAMAWLAHTLEVRIRKRTFSALAHIRTERIHEAFRNLRNAEIEGIAHFIQSNEEISRQEFRHYSKYLVRVPEVLAWGWVPSLKANEKDTFEQSTRERGWKSYQIWEVNEEGKRVHATGQELYQPIHFVESTERLSKYGLTPGRNLASLEPVRLALERSAKSRLVSSTDLLPPLPGATADGRLILIFRPVFGLSSPGDLRGFAMAAVDPACFLAAFLNERSDGAYSVALDLLQLRVGEPPESLASTSPPEEDATAPGPLTGAEGISRPVLAFGNTYVVTARPTAEFVAQHPTHMGWFVLLAGLGLTVASTIAVRFAAERREDLERLMNKRTADLAESIRRYNLLARHSRTFTWEVDPKGRFTKVSDVVKDVLGYPPSELVGRKHFFDLHPPEERENFKAQAFDSFRRKESFLELANPLMTKSGDVVWVSTSAIPLLNDAGELTGYQGTDTDITKRKHDENILARLVKDNQEAANRYAALIRASNTGAWEYHHDTGHMWTSPEYFAMLGRDPKDFPMEAGQPNVKEIWLDLIHPDDRTTAQQDFINYMKNPEGVYQHTFRMSHANGSWVWILSRGQLLRDAGGQPTPLLVGTHIDITARKKTEESLTRLAQANQEAADRYAALIRASNTGAWEYNDTTGLLWCSPEYFSMLGYTQQDLEPESGTGNIEAFWLDLLHPDDRPGARAHLTTYLKIPMGMSEQTFRMKHRDGHWVWIWSRGQVLRDARGNPTNRMVGTHIDITATKQAEEALRESEQQYRMLTESMKDVVWTLDPETRRFLYLSPSAENMTGHTLEEITARPLDAMIPESLREELIQRLTDRAARFQAGQISPDTFFTSEIPIHHKNGSLIMTELITRYWRNERTGKVELHAVARDITERRQAEVELKESRRRYAALLANLPGMAYRCRNDRAWTMEFVSEGCVELTGYQPEDLIANKTLSFSDVICPAYREELWTSWEEDLKNHRSFEAEYEITTRTGETKWVWEQGEGVYDDQGKILALEGFITDITARKLAEEERERLTRAIEQSGETIVITDAGGSILYVNPAFTRVSGYSREEAIGHHVRMLQSGKHDRAFYQTMWAVLTTGETWEGQLINKRKDGTLFTEQASISPVRDVSGQIIYFVAVKRDITGQLRDQKEKDDLQNQLGQAQKMESIGRLAGGVAHDFNNMLQAILGYTEMAIAQVPEDQPLLSDLQEIQKVAQRSAALTRQLQAFARKQAAQPTPLQLNEVLDGMSGMLRRLIGEDIQLTWKPGKELGIVKMDPSQLDQIVANLCINARDAIQNAGHITIETRNIRIEEADMPLHEGVGPGSYILLSIRDDGAGMPPEVIQHLFEPFFTTKKVGKGTGLGLSTVYGIVKQNYGHIQVRSQLGQGTTFNIYLPRHTGPMETVPIDEGIEPRASGKETILLAEDESAILLTTCRMLKSLGYEVLATTSSKEALHLAEEHQGQIDLLLTDVIMPEMNGPELVQELLVQHPALKHLFMSGYTANLIEQQGVQASHGDFIQKPFSRRELARMVRAAIDA